MKTIRWMYIVKREERKDCHETGNYRLSKAFTRSLFILLLLCLTHVEDENDKNINNVSVMEDHEEINLFKLPTDLRQSCHMNVSHYQHFLSKTT